SLDVTNKIEGASRPRRKVERIMRIARPPYTRLPDASTSPALQSRRSATLGFLLRGRAAEQLRRRTRRQGSRAPSFTVSRAATGGCELASNTSTSGSRRGPALDVGGSSRFLLNPA